ANDEFSDGNGNHINGIESFWGFAKHRLAKFKGIPADLFERYLKETEFRFNHRGQNLYKILLKMLRERCF
ncbi:MAG: transposase, partial [Oscillospiraceae bacterium]|nr:transposase [Oscillospiraceae bacterium]